MTPAVPARMSAMPREVEVRALAVRDSITQLTAMLRRAYAPLAAAGMNVSAATQEDDVTRQRTLEGQCLVALLDNRIVGTITVSTPLDTLSGVRGMQVPQYQDPHTGHFHQFAVAPDCRDSGIGKALLTEAERWARGRGYRTMAVDVPVPALELMSFFRHQGYRAVGELQWPGKDYASKILRKVLDRSPLQVHVATAARHARWAIGRLLDAFQPLTDEEYMRDLGLHHGSIHATLNHLVSVEQDYWWPRISEERSPLASLSDEALHDRETVSKMLRDARGQWVNLIESWSDDRLLGELQFHGLAGNEIVLPLASIMAHVFDHASQHRGEMIAALVRLGHPPPELGLANMLRDEVGQ